jgi:hypothetical protein
MKFKNSNMKERLEYLRQELRAERISLDELIELQNLVPHIDKNDVELLEAAGVEEFKN